MQPFAQTRAGGAGSRVTPLPGLTAASAAIRRVELLVMPCMWVGPPTTMRSMPAATSAVARLTGTTLTSHALSRRPSAIRLATRWVFPYIDS